MRRGRAVGGDVVSATGRRINGERVDATTPQRVPDHVANCRCQRCVAERRALAQQKAKDRT
jgi:hypothetical protein